jgi:ComF family protein
VVVPLHKKRLLQRKFNQSALLAKNLQKLAPQLIFFSDFLIRTKHTKPQTTLKKKQRENNLKNAFALNEKYSNQVRGKNFLLIDDVTTTGATLENCAKVLKKHGAKKIVTLTIAKTALS